MRMRTCISRKDNSSPNFATLSSNLDTRARRNEMPKKVYIASSKHFPKWKLTKTIHIISIVIPDKTNHLYNEGYQLQPNSLYPYRNEPNRRTNTPPHRAGGRRANKVNQAIDSYRRHPSHGLAGYDERKSNKLIPLIGCDPLRNDSLKLKKRPL